MRGGAPALAGARAVAAALAALALAGPACVPKGPHREPPEPALRIWMPGIVHWSGSDRALVLGLENGTNQTVQVEEPAPRRVRVFLYDGAGPDRVCGRDADAAGPAGEAVAIGPGEVRKVRVDLTATCGRVPPGEYRYEVGYEAPAVGGGPNVRLRVSFGHVLVQWSAPAALDRGSLGSGRGGEEAGGQRVGSPNR